MEAAHGPVPEVVQTVSGVVGVEAPGPTVGGHAAVLRDRDRDSVQHGADWSWGTRTQRTQRTQRTHRTQAEAAAAASTELVATLGTGEVETAPPGQAEDTLAAGTLWGQQWHEEDLQKQSVQHPEVWLPSWSSWSSRTCWRFLPMLW